MQLTQAEAQALQPLLSPLDTARANLKASIDAAANGGNTSPWVVMQQAHAVARAALDLALAVTMQVAD